MTGNKRPGYLTAYAKHAGISKPAAAEQLKRVSIDYMQPFDFDDADRRRLAMRHADRVPFSKPIYGQGDKQEEELPPDPSAGAAFESYAAAQAAEKTFKAKMAELLYEERVGSLVRKDQVEAAAFRKGRLVRDGVLNVPARLAGILAAETDQRKIHDLLEQELRKALEALALPDDDDADDTEDA